MNNYHVAVDIGASSGRLILADLSQNKLDLKEVHRFKNGFIFSAGHDRWNVTELFNQIIVGLEKVKKLGITNCIIGIDTWAVDYVLLDEDDQLLVEPVAYRDSRTNGAMAKVFEKVPKEIVYEKTGIQFLNFNTIFQYVSEDAELLSKATSSLLIPDYLAFRLTGKKCCEVTNASTTQLLNITDRDFDKELLEVVGLKKELLADLIESGTVIGDLREELMATHDLPECTVVAVGTHDTASAVVGVPATTDNWAYISSGTWSLIGVENQEPVVTKEALEANYTNEWGAYHTYRFLKNITGMWAVQEIARHLNYQYTYSEMAEQAYQVESFLQYVDLNDNRFTNPDNMIAEIQAYCRERGQIVPETVGELTMCVYSNLALIYAHEWKRLEQLTGRTLDVLHIVGGGSNVELLNQLTADVIGKKVVAGPDEATAIGNLLVQMITYSRMQNLKEARQWLAKEIDLKVYEPQPIADRDHLKKFEEMTVSKDYNKM
ncbi:Rhamnulokinase [Lactococcus lactis subsp. lactis]|uniref:rhamnulokinase n=1 Tax=Lactococcus lactis TaxID=1358 RepID=UPI00071C4B05|nr:rhamnulokinase [Lactococcus lactis]KST90835.1 Rhamnulokinase [Lactococcus lactis subsp. lactis]